MTFYIQICLHKEQILFIKSYFELIEFKRSCLAWDQYRLLNRIRSRINAHLVGIGGGGGERTLTSKNLAKKTPKTPQKTLTTTSKQKIVILVILNSPNLKFIIRGCGV